MRINRKFLYAGAFLVALGAALVAADLGTLDLTVVRDALRLWPVAIVVIGLAIVVRRSPIALPLGLLAAAIPGLALGGAIAIGPRFVEDCGDTGGSAASRDLHQGSFEGPASVSLEVSCGTLDVSTVAGSGWQLSASNTRGRLPAVASTARSLTIDDPSSDGFMNLDAGGDDWRLTLPASAIRDLSLTANANDGRVNLAGAQLDAIELTANASQLKIDLSDASLHDLSARANFSSVSIELPAGSNLIGDVKVNAGELRLCAPAGLGLRVTGRGFAAGVHVDGVDRNDMNATYISPDYATATYHADLNVNASFGSVEINPIGGCK